MPKTLEESCFWYFWQDGIECIHLIQTIEWQASFKNGLSIIEQLSKDWLQAKRVQEAIEKRRNRSVQTLEGNIERRCCECSGNKNPEGKRKRSMTICVSCKLGLHLDCQPQHQCKM